MILRSAQQSVRLAHESRISAPRDCIVLAATPSPPRTSTKDPTMNVAAPALPELRPLTTRIAFRDDAAAPGDLRYVDVKPDITQFGGRENGGRGWSQFTSLDDAVAAAQRVSNPTGDSTNL